MKVLGVDPGTRACGYAVVQMDGAALKPLDFGVVQSKAKSLAERLRSIHEGLMAVIERFEPDVLALEGAFYGVNARTAIMIGESRGIVLLAAARAGLQLAEYPPAVVKKAVVGTGRAHKSQVQQMVAELLNLPEVPKSEDAADALAIAICHCHRARFSGEP